MEKPMQRRQLLHQPNSSAIFPDELMVEIVSWLPVKHVMQLRCINKFFNTLIFDLHFVQIHLNKSSQNSHLALRYYEPETNSCKSYLVTLSIPGLLQNRLTIFHHSDPYYQLNDYSLSRHMGQQSCMRQWVVGSCNGLLCLFGVSYPSKDRWLCFWNPAMRTKSKNIWYHNHHFNFSFGYDNLTRSYRVVAVDVEVMPVRKPKSVVKVFSLGDNSWRDIQCLPLLPLYCFCFSGNNNIGVHLNGTINWLAFPDYINSILPLDQCVILSLDLSTETYTQLLLPPGFDKVSRYHPPKLVVLMDRFCFCHDFEKNYFFIWQMKDFGVQDSWIRLFKISYENFFKWVRLLPLYLSESGDTLILGNVDDDKEAFVYNQRDKTAEQIGTSSNILWSQAKHYVESLVSTH